MKNAVMFLWGFLYFMCLDKLYYLTNVKAEVSAWNILPILVIIISSVCIIISTIGYIIDRIEKEG